VAAHVGYPVVTFVNAALTAWIELAGVEAAEPDLVVSEPQDVATMTTDATTKPTAPRRSFTG
jgi:hypothetical protein